MGSIYPIAVDYSTCMQAYLLHEYGKFRDESKDNATHNIYMHTSYDAKKELARLKEARDELERKKFVTQNMHKQLM